MSVLALCSGQTFWMLSWSVEANGVEGAAKCWPSMKISTFTGISLMCLYGNWGQQPVILS